MTTDDREHAGSANPDGNEQQASERAGEHCWSCGAALTDGALFCGECGSSVGARAARPAEQPQAPDGLPETPAAERVAEPVDDPNESGLPPHGDALIESPVDGAEAFPERVSGEDHPTFSADPDESGLPPHGDALLDPDAASAWSAAGPDGEPASPGHADADDSDSGDEDADGDVASDAGARDAEADADSPGVGDVEGPEVDSADADRGDEIGGDGADVGDKAPTAVNPVLDEADGAAEQGDPVAPGTEQGEPGPGGPPTGFASEVTEHDDDDSADPLAPLTAEERFAAERLLDPDSSADKFVLQFSTGESATVYGSGLVGRNPVAEPGEYVDHFVVIRDPGRSVSKTHLEFGQDSGSFWVLDRFSGNGSVLREPDGAPKRCEPGRRYPVARGTRIEIGDQFFVVS